MDSELVGTEVELNGRKIDIASALPIITKDWKVLGKTGITPKRLATPAEDVEATAAYIFYVLHKADQTVKAEDIDNLTLTKLSALWREIARVEREVEGPFSENLTPSPGSTDGP